MSLCLCVSVYVCVQEEGGGNIWREEKKQREGEGLDPREQNSLSSSFTTTPPPLPFCTHTYTDTETHTADLWRHTDWVTPLLHHPIIPPSSANFFTEQLHQLDLDQTESSSIFFIASLAIMVIFCYLLLIIVFTSAISTTTEKTPPPVYHLTSQVLFLKNPFFDTSPLHTPFYFPPHQRHDYKLTCHHLETKTCTNVETLRQAAGLCGINLCTYNGDGCTGLRSTGAGLTGLWNSQSEADCDTNEPMTSLASSTDWLVASEPHFWVTDEQKLKIWGWLLRN